MRRKISVIIADDEALSREALEIYLSKRPEFALLKSCRDGAEALEEIQKLDPDFALLDIEMPEVNGIEVARQLANSPVVFITAYEHYAVKAFEENAIDYVLKPVKKERFDKMLDRVIDRYDQNELKADHHKILTKLLKDEEKYLKKIATKRKGIITFIAVNSIVYVESEGSFTKLHLTDHFEVCNFSIKQLEKALDPSQFVRVQKSFIINIDHIKSMESYFHGEYLISMSNEQTVKLSRGYKQNLDRILKQYL